MSTFLKWFAQNGDRFFTFVTVAAQMLNGVDGLSPHTTTAVTIASIIATAAHQSFFPNVNPGVKQ